LKTIGKEMDALNKRTLEVGVSGAGRHYVDRARCRGLHLYLMPTGIAWECGFGNFVDHTAFKRLCAA
jgi:hypothetical protein